MVVAVVAVVANEVNGVSAVCVVNASGSSTFSMDSSSAVLLCSNRFLLKKEFCVVVDVEVDVTSVCPGRFLLKKELNLRLLLANLSEKGLLNLDEVGSNCVVVVGVGLAVVNGVTSKLSFSSSALTSC